MCNGKKTWIFDTLITKIAKAFLKTLNEEERTQEEKGLLLIGTQIPFMICS